MTRTKSMWRRRLCMLFCAILIFSLMPITASADTAVISSAPMTSYFETYTSTGNWADLQTPAHWITDTGEVAYCLQTSKDNPYNGGYYTVEGYEYYSDYVLNGLQAILDHGYPATTMGFSDEEARYATANAIRFFLAENYADGVPQFLNLNVNGDWIRGKYGYEDLFRYSLYLLYMARTQDMTPVDGGTLEFTPDTITLTEDPSGQYFTGQVNLTKNISGNYSLMDNAPEGTLTITGHTGTQSETLTLQVPASFANQSCTLCAYGMDEAPAAALFFWAPAAANQQRIVTYVLDSTKSIFVRGFLTINAPGITERNGSIRITKTGDSGEALPGVSFNLYDSNQNLIDSGTTDGSGQITFSGLALGDYYYQETETLSGYVLDSTMYPITVSSTDQATEVTVTNTRASGSIVVMKTDADTGAALPSVHFTLSDALGNLVDEGDTGADGSLTFGPLPLGTYSLVETSAPGSYVPDNTPISIMLDTNGQTITKNITNSKALGSVSIMKTDAETGAALGGVHFALLDSSTLAIAEGDTESDGTLLFSGIPLGSYTLRETATVNGYVLDSTPVPVEITTAGQTVTINATNAPAKGGIAITKTDADTGAVIAGVHFILYDGNNNPVTEGDTLADGTLAFSDLPLGTYSLIETYTPTGYVLDSTPRTVSITENGQTVEIAVTNGTAIGSIAITKTDANTGAPLSGVHFILTDSTGATVSGGGTDENGVLIFSSLPLGTYTLMETETRNGYVLDSTPREVTISENGQIVEVGMGNTPARGSVSVIKTDAETGIPLAGVHFQLRDEAGALCAEGDTTADGTLTLSNIPLGSYTIQETTTPEGYVPDPTLRTVNITEDGQTVQITVENTPIRGSLEIIKKDVYDEIPLMGAGFRLYDSAGTQVAEGYTNAEGKLSFAGLAQGNYTFREFKAPKGYILDESVHTFTISDVGAPITKTVTNIRRPGTLIVKKQNANGSPLEGAAFLLEYSTDDGSTWKPVFYRVGNEVARGACTTLGLDGGQLTTGADGTATFTGLRADGIVLYRLTETKAPPGMSLLGSSILVGALPIESDNIYAEDSEVFDSKAFHYTLEVTATDTSQYRLPETGGDDGLKILPFAMMFLTAPIIFTFKSKKEGEITE